MPYAGHDVFFQDVRGQWWSTLFGNDDDAPVRKQAAVVPVEFDKQGHIRPVVQ
ncbi:hypothetical protein [Hymenobacter aquaticus]|uniref:hypothetical protein n=1 Tax=Hymenobacter aquaticus TaxID=1867101 RepID=UPI001436C76B|nr:hypothetical protein [Hymenobacter aquaticus]